MSSDMKKACKGDVVTRIVASVMTGIAALGLMFVLGFNNSSQSDYFPRTLDNCSAIRDFGQVDPNNIKRSTNIFCGIMLGLIFVGIAYEVFIIAGRILKIGFVEENNKRWACIDIFISALFMTVMIMTVAGCFLLAYLRQTYKGLFIDQLSTTIHFDVATGFLWATFGFGMNGIYQSFNIATSMSGIIARKSCCNSNENEATELNKPQL